MKVLEQDVAWTEPRILVGLIRQNAESGGRKQMGREQNLTCWYPGVWRQAQADRMTLGLVRRRPEHRRSEVELVLQSGKSAGLRVLRDTC